MQKTAPNPEPFDGGLPGAGPEVRERCFRLLRDMAGKLGWRYRLFIPATIALSAVFLLPPRFLQFFAGSAQKIEDLDARRFLVLLAAFGGAVALCLWLSVFLGGLLREWLRLRVTIQLQRDSLLSLHRTRLETLDSAHRGDWMTRMTNDLRNVEGFLTESIPEQIESLTMVVGAALLFYVYSGPVAAIPCAAAVLLAWLNVSVQRRVAPTLGRVRELEGQVFQTLIENFEGLRTIRTCGGERGTLERMEGRFREMVSAGMRIIRMMAGLMGLNEFAGQLVITGVLTVAALALKNGDLSAADVMVYPFFINVFLGHTKALVASAYDWNRFFIEGGRLAAVFYDETAQLPEPAGKEEADWSRARRFSVEGLVVRYGQEPPVIRDYSFAAGSGELIAVMGPSGCGKSTLLEALSGLRQPERGWFRIEGEDGSVDERDQAPVRLTAFVEQRPYLFLGSFRENLLLGNEGAGIADDEILERLSQVRLEGLVRSRGGLDSVLTDRGQNLSEGQRYRLTLCRALLAGRPFLMLDEPFAALDEESIDCVVAALEKERARGTGIVIVTHQVPGSLRADRVEMLAPAGGGSGRE